MKQTKFTGTCKACTPDWFGGWPEGVGKVGEENGALGKRRLLGYLG